MIRALLLLLMPLALLSQNYGYFAGSRSAGLGHGSVALIDGWATHHNQAALGFLEKPTLGISYENRYFLSDLSLGNVSFAYPTKLGTIGMALTYFGFELHNETKIGLNYAKAFGKRFSAGVQLDYQTYYVEEGTSSSGMFTFEIGVLAKPIEKLKIGFHIYNPPAAFKNQETDERSSIIARLGFHYEFDKKFGLVGEVKKIQDIKEHYVLGVEYKFVEKLAFRTGLGLQPLSNSFGLGLELGAFTTDLSYEFAQELGSTANISLQFAF